MHQLFGRQSRSIRGLTAIRHRLQSLIKIKSNQLRRARQNLHMSERSEAFRQKVPGIFGSNKSRFELTTEQASVMGKFWTDLWQQEGTYHRRNKDLKDWRNAVEKQANWKAPGPDGIHVYWLKVFPEITTAVMTQSWRIADSEIECSAWLVHGRTVMIP